MLPFHPMTLGNSVFQIRYGLKYIPSACYLGEGRGRAGNQIREGDGSEIKENRKEKKRREETDSGVLGRGWLIPAVFLQPPSFVAP